MPVADGEGADSGGTVYHGKQSRRHTLKFYCKAEELEAGEKHKLPAELEKTLLKSSRKHCCGLN
ncbi:phage/plasmid replication domain-containing protein [Kineobactrum salinum]|uniref:phage/plasmid replication domain-containing protein n=1 Tax=Kineobactrum salinum TaxID=2708301 RepID=UPI0038CC0510